MGYCSSLSSTRNSIYSIHSSYYSVSLSGSITSFSIILLLRTFELSSLSAPIVSDRPNQNIAWNNDFII